jgi:ectoine hydroxylase-related dioxygenase (phytanoyl-CoA dioxygenase family)
LVSQLIGPDIILWGCHVFCKPASEGFETPWHQDGHYWPIRPLATCTVWVALEPSTRDNGCLRVIPASHRNQELHEHLHEDRQDLVLNQRMAQGTFDENQAVDLELQPGQMSMHDVYMIHGAKPTPRPNAAPAWLCAICPAPRCSIEIYAPPMDKQASP